MNFGVLVFRNVEELDFAGPWEMLNMWAKIAGGPERCMIVAESAAPVVCAKGLSINPHVSFDQSQSSTFCWFRAGNARAGRKCVSDRLHLRAGKALPQRSFGMHVIVS